MVPREVAEFRILGPLEVLAGSRRLELSGSRQQTVLAMLLLNANDVVSVDRLEEAVYGEQPPTTARTQAMIAISALRRLLAASGDGAAISRRAQGYVLQAADGRLDALRFGALVTAAQAARGAGDLDGAAANYRDALRLWRGPALDGLDSLLVRAAATQLDEQRMAAITDRLDLELELGRHHELIGELVGLAEQFPLRDRLHGQLMLALHRSGRTAEALQAYQRVRRIMLDELGIEPGGELQRLQRAILTSDPALDLPAGPVSISSVTRSVPRLLPADIADFTGRVDQISQIRQQLTRPARNPRLAVPVVVITGPGGVGKTSLAVHASHALAAHFADGQLFADLHGVGTQPAGPAQVLERFLRALGMPGPQIPEGLDERAEAYRNLLADRRMLVVLDNAANETQVLPLLPGSESAAVLVTSRATQAGLAGATRIRLDVFDPRQSLDLLSRIAGTSRVRAEREAAVKVTEQCGHLPLALRIAAGRLAVRPHWDVEHLAQRLADQARRLDELQLGELGVRASISLSYYSAGDIAKCLLRRLALFDMPVFSGWLCAPLLDQQPADADDVLDELVSARLIEPVGTTSGVRSQYRFHDLVRLFARERLAAEEPVAEQRAALERALGGLLFVGEQAGRRYVGDSYLRVDPNALRWPLPGPLTEVLVSDSMTWRDRDRGALVAGVRQAADAGLVELCWSLAAIANEILESLDDWQQTAEVALEATRRAGHIRGQAAALYFLGGVYEERGQLDAARLALEEAARLFREVGDDHGFALAIRLTALIDRVAGRLDAAAAGFEQALAILRAQHDQAQVAYVLQNLARIRLESGESGLARELLTEALQLTEALRAAGIGLGERIGSRVLYVLGDAQLRAGEVADAAATFEQALAKVRAADDQVGEAVVLCGVGVAALRRGEPDRARRALERALELADTIRLPMVAARAVLGLGELALASGDADTAVALASRAEAACRDVGASLDQARALTLLSDAHRAAGDVTAAETAATQASALREGEHPAADPVI